jgi:hypothetical protein
MNLLGTLGMPMVPMCGGMGILVRLLLLLEAIPSIQEHVSEEPIFVHLLPCTNQSFPPRLHSMSSTSSHSENEEKMYILKDSRIEYKRPLSMCLISITLFIVKARAEKDY